MENSALQNLSIPYDWRITSVSIIGSYLYVSLLGQDLFRTNLNAWGWERINNTMKSMQSIYIYAYPNPCSAVAGNTYYSLGTTVVASNAFASYTVASDLNITVSYVQNYNYPIPRLFHSINQINDQLYLFGGMSQQSYFNDLWIFNPSNFNWTNYVTTGVVPSGRAYHASGSSGHALLIYGGEDVTGLKSDLFIFNSLQNSWTEIIPTTQVVPGSRKGACMVFSMPDVFIFGGETPNGFSGELWKYDMSLNKYSLISSLKEGISYSSCQVINNSFYSFCGIDINFDQVGAFFFDFNLKLWYLLNYNISCTNQGVAIAVGDYFINYGGEYNVNSLSRTFSIKSFHDWSFRSLLNFDSGVYFFGAGFSYIQSSLYYNYGGAINFYGDIDTTRPSSFFFTLDVSDFMIANNYTRFCSPGTYYYNFNCVFCLPGTYAEGFGNLNCSICIPGTYGPSVGATSIRQCYPCPQGKYNNIYGASSCIDCPHGSTCPAGSTTQSTSSIPIETVSIQPSNYLPKNYNQAILRFEIFYVLFAVVLLIVIERLFKVKHKIKFFDIFGIEHYYNEGEVIVLRKNFLGGMCTMITLFTIGFFIISQIFIYLNENTRELKALQPLPVLQNEVDKFIGDIEVSISLYYYGDSCVKNNQCSAEIYLEGFILAKVSDSYICRKTSISCVITYYCNSCEIGPNSYVQLNLKEKFSYSSIINVNVSSSSSVLDSISSVSIGISANDIFIGASPSEFYFLMIPSLFTSTVAGFPDKLTGYHVSFDRLVPGSEYKSEDLATVAGLSINVYLDNGLNGLLTTRYPNQTLLAILSGILGSIGGILSAAGLLMKLTEKFINDIQNYNQKSIKVRSMKENRKKLKQEALRLETREDDI
jgi:Kelch motif/Tyrosine-protein kinase ephrin type A/B receptor-like/Galactose oxidase, central domain